jgi:hypothetical protein
MKLSELIQHVGDEHIELQNIDSSLVKAKTCKQDGEITFATDKSKVIDRAIGNKPKHVGLIVWLPRERLPESMR